MTQNASRRRAKETTLPLDDDTTTDDLATYSNEWVRAMERYREQRSKDRVKKLIEGTTPDTPDDS